MNTLVVFGVYMYISVYVCIDTIRKWQRHAQPRRMLALRAVLYGIMLVVSGCVFIALMTHPADIQPVPGALSWFVWFLIANAILDILVRLGKTVGWRLRQRSG